MSKYTYAERQLIKDIVAALTIKRIPEPEILAEVYKQTNKTLSHSGLFRVKKSIKYESYKWYSKAQGGPLFLHSRIQGTDRGNIIFATNAPQDYTKR